jgi:hypothetical protein
MIGVTFKVNRDTRKLAARLPDGTFITATAHSLDCALVGYLVSGFFVTVLFYPFFWFNLAMTVALNNTAKYELAQAERARAALPAAADPTAVAAPIPAGFAPPGLAPAGWPAPRRNPTPRWRRPSQSRFVP